MLPAHQVPPVGLDELLARFILSARHVRENGTVKQDAFQPPLTRELSLTRHFQATELEIWQEGNRVARLRDKQLHGRADVNAAGFRPLGLTLKAAPLSDNPNHANAVGWPEEKPVQKIMAQELASKAVFVAKPR